MTSFNDFSLPVANVSSAPVPWPEGQSSRASGNFSCHFVPSDTYQISIEVDPTADNAGDIRFAIKRDVSGSDPTVADNLQNGSILSRDQLNHDDLYIARVRLQSTGKSPNGQFTLKFYAQPKS